MTESDIPEALPSICFNSKSSKASKQVGIQVSTSKDLVLNQRRQFESNHWFESHFPLLPPSFLFPLLSPVFPHSHLLPSYFLSFFVPLLYYPFLFVLLSTSFFSPTPSSGYFLFFPYSFLPCMRFTSRGNRECLGGN